MPKTITSVQVTYSDGTSASLTQNEFTSPFAPGGKIVLDKPKYTNGPDIAADPGSFDGDPASEFLAATKRKLNQLPERKQ